MSQRQRYIKTSRRLPREGRRVLGYMPTYLWPDMRLRIVVLRDGAWIDDRTGNRIEEPVRSWSPLPLPPERRPRVR